MKTTSDEAYRYCEKLTRSHYENFPIGWFLPKKLRQPVYSLYAFARTADDFSDEAGYAGPNDRLQHLEEWQRNLELAARGTPAADQPIFIALAETIRQFKLPTSLLADLLTAFRLDVTKKRYKSYAELEEYCRFSANPVGRLVLLLFGYKEKSLFEASDRICTGIQLVNHWQDIGVDLAKDRVYLPEEDLERFRYSLADLKAGKVNDAFCSLMRFQLGRTRSLFFEGRPLLASLRRRLRWQVSLMWGGPLLILDRIESAGFDVFRRRPTLSHRDLARIFLLQRIKRK